MEHLVALLSPAPSRQPEKGRGGEESAWDSEVESAPGGKGVAREEKGVRHPGKSVAQILPNPKSNALSPQLRVH